MRCATVSPFARPARWVAAFGIALLALGMTGCTAPDAKDRTGVAGVAALPPAVRDALDRAAQVYAAPLSGAQWATVYRLRKTDHPIYQLQGTNGRGNKVELEVTSAGRVIEVEEHGIPLSVQIVARGLNLADTAYEETLGYPGMRRSGLVGVRIAWHR